MSETLRQKQSRFVRAVVQLLNRAHEMGYDVTFGECWRPTEMAELYAKQGKGTLNSLHTKRLAIDLNLFRGGVYLDLTEHHRKLGEFWKKLGPDHCWGGDFKPRPDGNHYSITHDGRK